MTIFWFRRDLRLADNPAFATAVKQDEVLPVYILDNRDEYTIGGASKWWLHHSLSSLHKDLEGKLHFFEGNAEQLIPQLAKKYKAQAVFWSKCYEPAFIKTDEALEEVLNKEKIAFTAINGTLLWAPETLLKKDGTPYKVFNPFLKQCLALGPERKLVAKPKKMTLSSLQPKEAMTLDALKLLPTINWDEGIKAVWQPGEANAAKLLKQFITNKLPHYEHDRNLPAEDALSRLSPHLHYGEVSPLQIWEAVQQAKTQDNNTEKFIFELCWREFACHLLFHFPSTPHESYNERLAKLKWKPNKTLLKKWQQGQTGYPIVDAGMRELWQTGYMHNRVRMLTSSFLIKNLLTDWRTGADWFLDTLVDADLAVNTMNWQWIAGTGLDAAPFFRIFNPILQSKKYDAQGAYIKKFVPELSKLPARYVHEPWKAPKKTLEAAGVVLGKTYPEPCVDWQDSTNKALNAYYDTKS